MTTIAFRDVHTFTPTGNRQTQEVLAPPTQAPSRLLPATRVHPIAIEISVFAYAWLGMAFWLTFGGGETSLILSIILVLCIVYVGLLIGGAVMGRNMTPERGQDRSVREFLEGRVDIATGHVTGREAMMQIALLPIALAVGGTAIAFAAFWVGI
jgi:4-hydroxybenzoate polyprenyltransferase